MKPVKVGVIGCGNISNIYFQNMKRFPILELVACADLIKARAAAKAKEHGIRKACGVRELIADKSIDLVVNLTVPKAHTEVDEVALKAGKHVYSEKPLALDRDDGRRILELAEKKGLLVGCAPDTVLGAGIQTARKLIDDGWIGEPVSATAFMQCHGHENWHPDPEFYYEKGGGPMFDMGPYYLTALITLMGPVRRVCAATRITFPERTITSKPKHGKVVKVEVPTHVAGIMDFQNDAIGTIVTSFDVWAATLPCIEIHGTKGSMGVPDPNGFGGPVMLRRAGAPEWKEIPHSHGYADQSRGVGVADMAYAIRGKRAHRAGGHLAFHVLDIMQSFHESSEQGGHIALTSSCERPAPMPADLPNGILDS